MLLKIVLAVFGSGARGGFMNNRQQGKKQAGNRPMNSIDQNKQFKAVSNILGLNKNQREQLHRKIKGQAFGFNELLEFARDLFGL